MLQKLNRFHKTLWGHMSFGVLELAIAYVFVSLSIDRGNFWWYLLTLVFLVGALQNLIRLVGGLAHVRRTER